MKALLLLFLLSSLASAEDHVFRGFTLTGSGEPLRNAAMIVTDWRIAWVGPASQLKEQRAHRGRIWRESTSSPD